MTAQDAIEALHVGADILAHGISLSPISSEEARQIGAKKRPIIYTAWVFESQAQLAEGRLELSELDKQLAPERSLQHAKGMSGKRLLEYDVVSEMAQKSLQYREARKKNIRLLYEAGAPLLVGSDSPFFGSWAGSSLHHEMNELVQSGVPAADALLGATARAALLFETSPQFGTIQPGKVADLLLVEGNPLLNIQDTQKIVTVVQRGKIVRIKDQKHID